jgi:RHH-type transcriptional regulator, proline utilization regulon repressor / proline dehydrogenase / delta 1-pyrroline-5-carboxylate dehydrogenase
MMKDQMVFCAGDVPQRWQVVAQALRSDEAQAVQACVGLAAVDPETQKAVAQQARHWVASVRDAHSKSKGMRAFFTQMDLSSEEGVGLMCLAEALLRVPDSASVDALLADQLASGAGVAEAQRAGWFAHAAHWGLMLGAEVMVPKASSSPWAGVIQGMVKRLSAPVVRQSVRAVMAQLGEHFVLGETIESAVKRATRTADDFYTYSYDMLGEAAVTEADAQRYFEAYQHAIEVLKDAHDTRPLLQRPGISIKLSALHARYTWDQRDRCVPVLVERLTQLVQLAQASRVSLTLDAEEANRLVLSLDILEQLFAQPDIAGWGGLGLAVQAYQKSAVAVIEGCIALARQYKTQMPIRLVKGAYWDSEIKDAQVHGIDFAVFTRKISTDVSYLACVRLLFEAKDAVFPQFATHNAHTVASILQMAQGRPFEFQCLHGMGQVLYDHVKADVPVQCRIYAPVGSHQTLLPYLVRRLLENGANTSFVNQLVNPEILVDRLIACPIAAVRALEVIPHPRIPDAAHLYSDRQNAQGLDFNDPWVLDSAAVAMTEAAQHDFSVMISEDAAAEQAQHAVMGPVQRDKALGTVQTCSVDAVEAAVVSAQLAYRSWRDESIEARAACLNRAADALEAQCFHFMSLCVREAGKTWQDALDEVREAIDFLRYYAQQSCVSLQAQVCPGPTGEANTWRPVGRGVILCLSPWNFPVAIFTGQVSAALVAGNAVLAKPASQTVVLASEMVRLFHASGIPESVCQLLPGGHDVVGEPLVADNRVQGVMLTGSTRTAQVIAQNLAARSGPIVPLIAETGGQNVMIVDSTALPEQVVVDVVDSAFKSAGQRCSACRVLYLQAEIADHIIELLVGAMSLIRMGDPLYFSTDIGPVIDDQARDHLRNHVQYLDSIGATCLAHCQMPEGIEGSFFPPHLYEIESLSQLKDEVFGPILHVVRYERSDLNAVLDAIHSTGFGLTLGIHSRILGEAERIAHQVDVGNVYINRNMVGAVVGVQPFGGDHLSGTGPKAGGPWYLQRLCKEQTLSVNTTAVGGNASLLILE